MAKKRMSVKKRPEIENPTPRKLGMQGLKGLKAPGLKKPKM